MKNKVTNVKSQGLRLIRRDGLIIDQYGRILEEYRDKNGKLDLRPTGQTTYANH